LATAAARKQLPHLAYLAELIEGEATLHENREIGRRIKNARFPVLKTMEDFQCAKKDQSPADSEPVPSGFIADNTNVVFINTVGLGTLGRQHGE
jgi:IstB-like ATP binding protein